MPDNRKNEGEGSRKAAREYNNDTQKFVKSGKVEQSAKKARNAIEGDEADKLKRAEEKGRKQARN